MLIEITVYCVFGVKIGEPATESEFSLLYCGLTPPAKRKLSKWPEFHSFDQLSYGVWTPFTGFRVIEETTSKCGFSYRHVGCWKDHQFAVSWCLKNVASLWFNSAKSVLAETKARAQQKKGN